MTAPPEYQAAPLPPQNNPYDNNLPSYNVPPPTQPYATSPQAYYGTTSPPPLYTQAYEPTLQPYVGTSMPPSQVAFNPTPVTTTVAQPPPSVVVVQEQPPPPPPTTVVVVEKERGDYSSALVAAWVLFGLGFIFPLLWCSGFCFLRKGRSARLAGILSLSFLFAYIAVVVIIVSLFY
jgi:hypothetical protein